MTEKNYSEREIKDALDNLEVPYNPASWEKLEARLNAPFTEEKPAAVEEVDKLVRPKIERFEAVYDPAHWQIMADRLRLIAARRRQIASTKLLETALVLLFLGNLPTWLGLGRAEPQRIPISAGAPIAGVEEPDAEGFIRRTLEAKARQAAATAIDLNDPAAVGPDASLQPSPDGSLDIIKESPVVPASEISITEEVVNSLRDFFFTKKPAEEATKPPLPIAALGQPYGQVLGEKQSAFGKLAAVEPVETRMTEVDGEFGPTFLPFEPSYIGKKERRFKVGIFIAPQANLARTPALDPINPDIVQLKNGWAFGLNFSATRDRFGFETGLTYESKSLDRNLTATSGSLEEGFTKTVLLQQQQYEIAGVPLRATMRIGQVRHVSFSARLGASACAIVQKNNVKDRIDSYSSGNNYVPGILALQRNNKQERRGLFEGGSLMENGFITADAAVRLERPIGRRLSLFVEPVFQHTVVPKGIGLRHDRLSTFSLQTGVTATL